MAEATRRDVEYIEERDLHRFRVSHASGAHWLQVAREVADVSGEEGVLERLPDVVPHLLTEGQSLRVTLTANRVIAEPAAD